MRRDGKRIAFVPTMGYFHEGHLALMRKAKDLGDVTVISIFVNPAQFAPHEDYESYPRDPDRDLALAHDAGVDLAFLPHAPDMYPDGYQTAVEVPELAKPLCGISRPIFFRGVATVVCKLFHIVKPHVAVFGEKDYQQLLVIRRMARDLDMDIEVVGLPIVREQDGLAMSSRNVYLDEDERQSALKLSGSLQLARKMLAAGTDSVAGLLAAVRGMLEADPRVRVDYAEIRDADNLELMERVDRRAVLALAAFVGKARLIDNMVLEPPVKK